MAGLRLEVVTPQRTVLTTEADSVIVPGAEGRLGFLKDHAPIVAGLKVGLVEYGGTHEEKNVIAVAGGFVELADNKVSILADAAEIADEIDEARAKAAKDRAERRLRERQANIDRARAEAALNRALNRLQAVGSRND